MGLITGSNCAEEECLPISWSKKYQLNAWKIFCVALVCVPVFPSLWDPPHLDALERSLSAHTDIDIGVAVRVTALSRRWAILSCRSTGVECPLDSCENTNAHRYSKGTFRFFIFFPVE